jgi:hypothetical protein
MENNKTSFHKFMDATNAVKIELGVIQDIDADMGTVSESLRSIRKGLLQIESLIVKNADALKVAGQAISKVQGAAKEIGADSVLAEAQKRADLHKNLTNTVNKTLSQIGGVISNL